MDAAHGRGPPASCGQSAVGEGEVAYCTNGWMTGYPQRARRLAPVAAIVVAEPNTDGWGESGGVCATLCLTRAHDESQMVVFLNEKEVRQLADSLLELLPAASRKRVALRVLRRSEGEVGPR